MKINRENPYGVRAVLSHQLEEGNTRLLNISASHSLAPAEKNYSLIDKEALAKYSFWGEAFSPIFIWSFSLQFRS